VSSHAASFRVMAALFRGRSASPAAEAELFDHGLEEDSTKGDGHFSGALNFSILRSEVGEMRVVIAAIDNRGGRSNAASLPVQILRSNRPPLLSDLVAPDTVRLSNQTQVLTLRITASDPDGLRDIHRVVFNSFRPDGQPSAGNPFQMHDDGATGGDERAGDGVFTLQISLPPTTAPGRYRFEFQAFDRSSVPSNVVIHHITVLP
jgi:hypothetical protein